VRLVTVMYYYRSRLWACMMTSFLFPFTSFSFRLPFFPFHPFSFHLFSFCYFFIPLFRFRLCPFSLHLCFSRFYKYTYLFLDLFVYVFICSRRRTRSRFSRCSSLSCCWSVIALSSVQMRASSRNALRVYRSSSSWLPCTTTTSSPTATSTPSHGQTAWNFSIIDLSTTILVNFFNLAQAHFI